MIANCDVLITRFSSTAYVGLALGKEVYSDFDVDELKTLTPIQNGRAAANIATVCRELLEGNSTTAVESQTVEAKRPSSHVGFAKSAASGTSG
jgi:hypothetical protein